MLQNPFSDQNYMVVACWACDAFIAAGSATVIVPRTSLVRRPPNTEEIYS
jgi:hypothetical protein